MCSLDVMENIVWIVWYIYIYEDFEFMTPTNLHMDDMDWYGGDQQIKVLTMKEVDMFFFIFSEYFLVKIWETCWEILEESWHTFKVCK